MEDQLERLHDDEQQILTEELKLQERRAEVYARRRRLKKQLALLERKRKGMFDRELASIEEMERLEKEDRDARRAAGEDVPTPERSPSPPVEAPPADSVAGVALSSGVELWMDPSFWGDPVSAGDQGFGDGTL